MASSWGNSWASSWGNSWGSIGTTLQFFTGVSHIGGVTRHTAVTRPAFNSSSQLSPTVSGNLSVDTVQGTSVLINGDIP